MHQDSDDEGNEDSNDNEKTPTGKEYSGQSPSPAAEDSEPEMTEEEREYQLVSLTFQMILIIKKKNIFQCYDLFKGFLFVSFFSFCR